MKRLQPRDHRLPLLYGGAVGAVILCAFLGLVLGSTTFSFSQFDSALFGGVGTPEGNILWYVRFPRTAACLLCGAALAVSGAVIQGVLNNRLASPGIIGVNAGAGLAVTICSALGILGGWRLSLFAFLGAFAAVLAVSMGAKRWGASRGTVILMGVALNSLFGAVSDTIVTVEPTVGILRNQFKIGDFSFVTYAKLLPGGVMILLSLLAVLLLSRELEVLTLGEETARSLGMNTGVVRVLFLLLSALLAGAAVSLAGLLSFVGLLVPHAVRRLAGREQKHLLPLCALFGAAFVTLCDTLARTVFSPYEIPVGIVMAFLGAPFFLFVLLKGKGGADHA